MRVVLEVYSPGGTVSRVRVHGAARTAFALLAVSLALALPAGPGHAQVVGEFPSQWVLSESSTPQSQVLSWSPSRLRLSSSSEPKGLALTSQDGVVFPLAPASLSSQGVFEILPPTLPAGQYWVSWQDGSAAREVGFSVSANSPPPPALVWQSGELRVDVASWVWAAVPASILLCVALFLFARRKGKLAFVPLTVAVPVGVLALWLASPSPASDPASECLLAASRNECLSSVMVSMFSSAETSGLPDFLTRLAQDSRFSGSQGDHPCHEAAHDAGRELVTSGVALDQLVVESLAGCSTGLVHGAVEGWAPITSDTDLLENFDSVCAKLTSVGALEECWHGLGHAAGLRFGSRPAPSLEACAVLAQDKAAALCAQGVGMQLATTFMMGLSFNRGINAQWLPEGLTVSPPMACKEFAEPRSLSMCFAGAFTYLNFGYYGGPSGPAPSALPVDFRPDRMAAWCSSLRGKVALECAFGLGVGLADPPSVGSWPEKARPCAALSLSAERSMCAAGVVVNSMADSYSSLEDVPDSARAEVCTASGADQDCLSGSALARGWSLVLPELPRSELK